MDVKYIVKSYERKDCPIDTEKETCIHHVVHAANMKEARDIFSDIHPEYVIYDIEEIPDVVVYGV